MEMCSDDMTLLARAVYDNLADAPDELTFRKGDIVTVIERDVDGIVGWWLCLLHGRQGIAPGNRLQIIPQFDLANNSRNGGSQGSLSNDDLSDSFDFNSSENLLSQASEYDTLPAPVKATDRQLYDFSSPSKTRDNNSSSQKPGNIIPYPDYAVPQGSYTPHSDYDIVPTKFTRKVDLSPAELYDIPQGIGNSPKKADDEVYDVPTRRPTIQQKTSTPTSGTKTNFQNVMSAFTSIPENTNYDEIPKHDNGYKDEFSEIYDTPKSTKSDVSQDIYDIPPSALKNLAKNLNNHSGQGGKLMNSPADQGDIYDTVPTRTTSSAEEVYDTPPSNVNKWGLNSQGSYNQPVQKIDNDSYIGREIYDVPPSNNNNSINVDVNNLKNVSNDFSKQPGYSVYRSESNQRSAEDIYDFPLRAKRSTDEDIYDHPPLASNANDEDIYDHPPRANPTVSEEIYDHPPRANPTVSEEIYDHPPRANQTVNEEIYDHPPRGNRTVSEEIYDHPPRVDRTAGEYIHNRLLRIGDSMNEDLYDHPPHERNDDIYDHPPNRLAAKNPPNDDFSQGIYDVPIQHDINKVMKDIAGLETSKQSLIKPYSKHQRRERNSNQSQLTRGTSRRFSEDDDDYVDYQDIYGKEPPAEMVKEMEKGSDSTQQSSPKRQVRKHSSFEQINLEAVKVLKITQKQAYERLSKLHLAVDTSVTTLVSHSSGDWLDPKALSFSIDAIKDMAAKVKLSLRLMTEFGLGAVVNAKTANSDDLADNIKADIEPLLECYYKIKVCLIHLDGCKWKVPEIRNKDTEKFFATVNAIIILAGRVPEACRKLTANLNYSIKSLFTEDPPSPPKESIKTLAERMEDLKLKSPRSKSPEPLTEKGKLKPVHRTIDDKKVREILELDTRPKWNWKELDGLPSENPEGADLSPTEMKKEFQSRRQKGYNSTLPRRPPVPPKPSLPTNRRSMASCVVDDELRPNPMPSKIDTLVTDFVADDGRKKYASDPTQSPMEPEPTRKPEWGGSCPELDVDDRSNYTPHGMMVRATSSGTAASTTSTASSIHDPNDDVDGNHSPNKAPSDSNLYSQSLSSPRVAAPPIQSHLRSASLPWDDNKIPFTSYEKERQDYSSQLSTNQKRLSKLDHRDSEALLFFLQRVESQVLILREAVRNLTESVTNGEAPQMFVAHSKFVILTAHKVVHAGEELCGKLMNNNLKFRIKKATTHLSDSIRGVVAGTKQAALDYPNQNSLMEMMTTVLSVGESVREVHREAKKGLEL